MISRCAVLCALAALPAWTGPILTATVTSVPGGFEYSYSLTSDALGQKIGELVLVDIAAYDFESVRTPTGWALAVPLEAELIVWTAGDPSSSASLFNVVSGFGFRSPSAPGTGRFVVVFDEDPEGNTVAQGVTSVPALAVPEPRTTWMLAGLIAIGAVLRSGPRGEPTSNRVS